MNGFPAGRQTIWIDLDNTPHVPFFKPIVRELKKSFTVLLTARDAFQVCELAEKHGLQFHSIGRHYGKNRLLKLAGLGFRTLQLLPLILRHKPHLAVSHGARSQILLSNLLRIPSVAIDDYEHSEYPPFSKPRWLILPEAIPPEAMRAVGAKMRSYAGIKEDVYAPEFKPDPQLLSQLGLDEKNIIVTVRPPATEAHYHNPESDRLFCALMDRACSVENLHVVLLPRNLRQALEIQQRSSKWFLNGRTIIPKSAVDGLNLVWHSDLVISGGGTMNREAAALGVPVYSIFRGKTAAIDRRLQEEGRLELVQTVEDIQQKIAFRRRDKTAAARCDSRRALPDILAHLRDILDIHSSASIARN